MKSRLRVVYFVLFAGWLSNALAGAATEGYLTVNSHDEIVAKAKKEGKLNAISSLDAESFKPMMQSFSKKYPFIEIRMEEIGGPEALQRFLLELKGGTVKDIDTSEASSEFYVENAAHAMKLDILGM